MEEDVIIIEVWDLSTGDLIHKEWEGTGDIYDELCEEYQDDPVAITWEYKYG